jgi:hypothetical protein
MSIDALRRASARAVLVTVCTALISGALMTAGPGGAAAQAPATSGGDAPRAERLAVLTAREGALVRSGDRHLLTLRGVAPRSTWFFDRPFHGAGTSATSRLIPAYFRQGDSLPNAALEIVAHGGERSTVIVELASPVLRDGARTVRFTARVLQDVPERLSTWRPGRSATPPKRFGRTTLYLDGLWQSCEIAIALPSTSMVQGSGADFDNTYGGYPYLAVSTAGYASITQSAGLSEGCGATGILSITDSAGWDYDLTVTWSNPGIGSNTASCQTETSEFTCQASAPPSGSAPVFEFEVSEVE